MLDASTDCLNYFIEQIISTYLKLLHVFKYNVFKQ
jgi:hypothetical protein